MPHISRAQAKAFRERWRLVNDREKEELSSTPASVRLQQFNTLLAWAKQFEWMSALSEGENEVRERWAWLRKTFRSKNKRKRKKTTMVVVSHAID